MVLYEILSNFPQGKKYQTFMKFLLNYGTPYFPYLSSFFLSPKWIWIPPSGKMFFFRNLIWNITLKATRSTNNNNRGWERQKLTYNFFISATATLKSFCLYLVWLGLGFWLRCLSGIGAWNKGYFFQSYMLMCFRGLSAFL